MKKLAIAAIVAAALAVVTSGAALWRTRDLSKPSNGTTASTGEPSTASGEPVAVPDTTNKNFFGAGQDLSAVGLKFKVVRTPSATVAKSIVISQNPAPGTTVPAGTEVELTVSNGSP